MIAMPRSLRLWGLVGALLAALFAVWMLFFPQLIPTAFAWNVQPRAAQAFIGAGYLFRTYFFLLFVFVPDWRQLRWTYYGNLLFTGALLLATLWHADQMHWRSVVAHVWILFYTMEPVIMHFSIPTCRLRAYGGTVDHRRTHSALVPAVPDPRGRARHVVRADAGHQPRVAQQTLALGV